LSQEHASCLRHRPAVAAARLDAGVSVGESARARQAGREGGSEERGAAQVRGRVTSTCSKQRLRNSHAHARPTAKTAGTAVSREHLVHLLTELRVVLHFPHDRLARQEVPHLLGATFRPALVGLVFEFHRRHESSVKHPTDRTSVEWPEVSEALQVLARELVRQDGVEGTTNEVGSAAFLTPVPLGYGEYPMFATRRASWHREILFARANRHFGWCRSNFARN